MIYLRVGTGATFNTIYLNLIDRLEDDDLPATWSWLMIFTNDFTKKKYTLLQILGQSVSHTKLNNLVRMPIVAKNGGVANGLLQEVVLPDTGYYTYEIYRQNSTTNLDYKMPGLVSVKQQIGKLLAYNDTSEQQYESLIDGTPNNFIYVP